MALARTLWLKQQIGTVLFLAAVARTLHIAMGQTMGLDLLRRNYRWVRPCTDGVDIDAGDIAAIAGESASLCAEKVANICLSRRN
ncbi:unnamed protein product [Cylicostephanus goldi]|uniref:Uncharacterized protein n=1 Tax=Cylicostephanus goldi TaxID=71465 RepID=A0A3P6R874_CYLGO|nr:unnamed protein product [Cylicostephanus goldi]